MREGKALYKKAYYQCSRRAILENELIMTKFAEDVVRNSYDEGKLVRFNDLLTRMFDNDMFELLMGRKTPEDYEGRYDFEICKDMSDYAALRRKKGEPF